MAQPIFTNKALYQMKQLGLSESSVLNAYNSGTYEKGTYSDLAIKKYPGSEVGVAYIKDKLSGNYIITNVWARNNRR